MIEPLDGKGLVRIQRHNEFWEDRSVTQLLALVDELREALDWRMRTAVSCSCEKCGEIKTLLARTAPPVESRSVERRLAAQQKEIPDGR